MDRLHAFCYFLEGLLPRAADARCAAALRGRASTMVAHHLREIAPEFARSDVFAQLLRVRLYADGRRGAAGSSRAPNGRRRSSRHFQREDGGYWFGRKGGEWLPFVESGLHGVRGAGAGILERGRRRRATC